VLSDAPDPLPESQPLAEDSAELPMVHAAGDQSAVWRAGEAFIKAHDILWSNATREHVTLSFLKAKGPLDFDFPEVIYPWSDPLGRVARDGRGYATALRLARR
jgi:hypothetical protein